MVDPYLIKIGKISDQHFFDFPDEHEITRGDNSVASNLREKRDVPSSKTGVYSKVL